MMLARRNEPKNAANRSCLPPRARSKLRQAHLLEFVAAGVAEFMEQIDRSGLGHLAQLGKTLAGSR